MGLKLLKYVLKYTFAIINEDTYSAISFFLLVGYEFLTYLLISLFFCYSSKDEIMQSVLTSHKTVK